MRVTKLCLCVCVKGCVCDQVVCVTKFQSRRTQSESEHAVWWQLASHLAQPEHIAHCFVLASSRTPGQWDDRRHHVGLLLGTGTHAQWRTTKRCKVKATTAATKIGEHHAALSLRTSGAQLSNRQKQTSKQQLFQSQRAQSESEHPVWWQLASHLTQLEHMAHCSVLASSFTPGQRGDRRHHVGLLGTGAHSKTWYEPDLTQRAHAICSRSCDLIAFRWTLRRHVADCSFFKADAPKVKPSLQFGDNRPPTQPEHIA